ncbi:hypothetical protein IC229_01655 [Spirosoma sp. BT702]|uniref:Outer membrane beta-barrel protein n=1 Tax=Spirosoma profusum TaxID=2771354 RepID=A0A926XSR4_9BACT|nr:hypothetical protein [Spirosoma profusum]MBD2699323.1 hypothetical protein [Spirosoma profusum]
MKHIFFTSLFLSSFISAQAQEIVIDTSSVAPPPVRVHGLTADPDERLEDFRYGKIRTADGKREDYLQFRRLKEIQTLSINVEGGFRSETSTLSNSFNGLINSNLSMKANWSVLLGYSYRNIWAIEAGYGYLPIRLNVSVTNGSNPLIYNYQNSGNGATVRLKRRIGSGKRSLNNTGFWLTGGAWLIPNGSGQIDPLRLTGRSNSRRNRAADTLQLNINTSIANRFTGMAELGAEYTVRLASSVELGFYARKYWGIGDALQSTLTYKVNNAAEQQSFIKSDGSGWGFGVALRFILEREHEFKDR